MSARRRPNQERVLVRPLPRTSLTAMTTLTAAPWVGLEGKEETDAAVSAMGSVPADRSDQ